MTGLTSNLPAHLVDLVPDHDPDGLSLLQGLGPLHGEVVGKLLLVAELAPPGVDGVLQSVGELLPVPGELVLHPVAAVPGQREESIGSIDQ